MEDGKFDCVSIRVSGCLLCGFTNKKMKHPYTTHSYEMNAVHVWNGSMINNDKVSIILKNNVWLFCYMLFNIFRGVGFFLWKLVLM